MATSSVATGSDSRRNSNAANSRKLCKYLESLDDSEENKVFIERYSLQNLDGFQIFKSNPKFYARLKLITESDNFYEAHQLFKTINFRCMNNNLIEESLVLLFNGIIYFLSKNSFHCGFDLSKSFIETLKASNMKNLTNDLRTKIKIIHSMLKSGGIEERNEFSLAVLKWSTNMFEKSKIDIKNTETIYTNYQKTFGHFDLHRDFAINLWKEKNYIQSRYHFLHSLDAQSFAHMMVECHLNFGYPSEYDLFLAQSVLQYISVRNLPAAEEFFFHYVKVHPAVKKVKLPNNDSIECFESPLINFLLFLIKALKNFQLKVYQLLLQKYKPSLDRDASLTVYLDRISEYYFNIKKPTRSDGLFSNIMRMLTTNSGESPARTSNQSSLFSTNLSSNNANNENTSDDDWDDDEDNDLD